MSKRASPTDVIDLTENDGFDDAENNVEKEGDEAGNANLQSLRRRLSSIPAAVAATLIPDADSSNNKRVKRERMGRKQTRDALGIGTEDEVEDVTEDRKPAAKTTAMDHEDEDVEVMEAPAPIPSVAKAAAARSNNSDDIRYYFLTCASTVPKSPFGP
jgi:DNA-binding FadR family transcriptional regulator